MSLRTTPPLRARTKSRTTDSWGSYTLRKRHQGAHPGALRREARRSGASGCGGCPCRSGGRV